MSGATLRIDVLGPLRIRRGSEPVALGSARQRRVLARLLIDRAHPVSADELVEAGWGADLPQRPAGALHTVVSRVRSALAPDAHIDLTPAGYVLTGAEVDAERFDRLIRLADMTTDGLEEAQALDEALGLWRGRAYEGLELLVIEPEAERLAVGWLTAIERRAELFVSAGSASDAVPLLKQAVQNHPFREASHAALMRALYHAGNIAGALDVFHDFRERLIRELGLDPSPPLVELHRRILANDLDPISVSQHRSDRSAIESPSLQALLAPSPSPFVGRGAVVATLRSAVSSTRLLSVVGAGGVGKTRLAAEALPAVAADLGLRLVVVHCESLVDDADLRTAVAAGVRIAPSDLDPHRVLAWALDRVPTMLVFDGAEVVRPAVAELIDLLLAECASLRVVATTRLPLGSAHEHLVPIAPLDVDTGGGSQVQRLFDAAARRARPDIEPSEADRDDVIEICRLVDGLPLAIELAGARSASLGLADVRDGLSHGVDIIDDPTGKSRRSLSGIVEWSYSCLEPEAALLLGRLSVPPGPVDASLAAALSPSPTASIGAAFDQLVTASLLSPVNASQQSPRYRMSQLVRQFASSQLTDVHRRRAETDLAGWAMDLVSDAIQGALGPDDRTVLDHVEAHVANLERAIRLARRDDAEEIAGRLALVSSHRLPFSLAHLIHTVGARESEMRSAPSPLAVGAAARAATLTGDFSTGLVLARSAWRAAGRDPEVRYLAAHTLSIAHLYEGDPAAATAWARRVIESDNVPAARLSDAHATVALAATYEDDLATARHHAEMAQAFAGAAGARAYRAFAAYASGEVAVREGDRPHAHASLRRSSRLAVDAGSAFIEALSDTALASLLVRGPEAGQAAGLLHKVLAYWYGEGVWPQVWTSARLIAELCVEKADYESALLLLRAAHLNPGAPDVTGSDAARESTLVVEARSHLDNSARRRIDELAHRLAPSKVVEHASAVTDLGRHASG